MNLILSSSVGNHKNRERWRKTSSVFLCFFDSSSLCTNDPLAETIQNFADALYSSELPPVPFPCQIFAALAEMATSSVEFSCSDIVHRQNLEPALANIFVGYYES